jgi:hypothetical protein
LASDESDAELVDFRRVELLTGTSAEVTSRRVAVRASPAAVGLDQQPAVDEGIEVARQLALAGLADDELHATCSAAAGAAIFRASVDGMAKITIGLGFVRSPEQEKRLSDAAAALRDGVTVEAAGSMGTFNVCVKKDGREIGNASFTGVEGAIEYLERLKDSLN